MARNNNKYASINFNHILHKSPATASAGASYSSVARSHGRMLVLSRPSPKKHLTLPTTSTNNTTSPPLSPAPKTPDQAPPNPDLDQISLRPLGHTGPNSSLLSPVSIREREKEVAPAPAPAPPAESPKSDRFVPPHLRPGFVGKQEIPGPDVSRGKETGQRMIHQQQLQRPGYFGSPGRYGENGRPKSGGYERIRMDPNHACRPRSSGTRPSSTG